MKKLIYLFLGLLIVACTTDDNNNYDNSNDLQKEWLYTHTAIEATATSSTTLVMPFTADIFAFTDRPNREHKYISGDEFASYWNDYDENSFKLDPPNAVLTWVDADGVSEVEVVITDANFDGNNVIYTIENTTITANQSFEEVSLFVDGNENNNAVYVGPNNIVMASAGAVNNEQGNIGNVIYTVVNLTTLKFLIEQGDDVTKAVPSLVTDMSNLFKNNTSFNQVISTWDVSNVTNMDGMFQDATSFNQDITSWDVSNVTDMKSMFEGATDFNQDISNWDFSNVTDMSYMFQDATAFNQPFENWDVSNVTNCSYFGTQEIPNFTNCAYVYLASNGVTIKATAASANGYSEEVNGVTYTVVDRGTLNTMISNEEDVTKVCTSLITVMGGVFADNTSFNQDISSWDVSNVTNMGGMFYDATSFNQDISSWDVSNVSNMGQVTGLGGMFGNATSFNQPIGDWDVSNVTDMNGMFGGTNFNQDISSWDVSSVTNMGGMFNYSASFNQDISSWDVSSVTNMSGLFQDATSFNQDISSWSVDGVTSCDNFSEDAPLTEENTPNFTNCTP